MNIMAAHIIFAFFFLSLVHSLFIHSLIVAHCFFFPFILSSCSSSSPIISMCVLNVLFSKVYDLWRLECQLYGDLCGERGGPMIVIKAL